MTWCHGLGTTVDFKNAPWELAVMNLGLVK
jgi:hypothetical protein